MICKFRVPWLTTDWVLSQFSKNRKKAIFSFIKFVKRSMDEGERKEFLTGSIEGRILGDDHFAEKVLTKTYERAWRKVTLKTLIHAVCAKYGIKPEDLSRRSRQKNIPEARAIAALLVRDLEYLTLTALSIELRRDLSGLSQAAARLEKKLRDDRDLSRRVASPREALW